MGQNLLPNDEHTPPAARLHVPGLLLEELRAWLVAHGEPRFRADQIAEWVYRQRATSFEAMSNLSMPLRRALTEQAELYRSTIEACSESADETCKLLLKWPDGCTVETVLIPEPERQTVCVSSQVGCPVGCTFCASGLDGVQRNLTAGEIVEQALRVRDRLGPDRRLSHIVFMGMGEPLANYDNVLTAIRILNAPWGLNIGARRITVSTVGLPAQIRRLAQEDLQLNLALSLHAPDEELRRKLIPWGKVPLPELLDACRAYFDRTGREITLEYILLEGVNTAPAQADRLAAVCRGLRCNVNLLRYNPVPGLPYERPSSEAAYAFQTRLRRHGVNAHIRTSRGRDIDAACGQLRRAHTAPTTLSLTASGRSDPAPA